MSTIDIASLLKRYNPELYQKKNASAVDTSKLASGSYTSATEYMLDKYRGDQNFNASMYHDAAKLGAQEMYLSLIAANAGKRLDDKFYDSKYQTYESAMLELYKNAADDVVKTEYFKDVFNPATNQWEQQSIGFFTEREKIQYDLDQAYALRDQEMTRQLEQYRKDTMDGWEQIGSHTGAVVGELTEGLTSAVAGVLDIFGALGYAGIKAAAGQEYFDQAFVDYYAEHGLLALDKETFRAALDEHERKYTTFRDIDGNITTAGTYFGGIANSLGMMIPSMLLAIPTGGTSLAFLPQVTFYTSIFSNNVYENATNANLIGSPAWVKITNAFARAGAEYLIEWSLGKIMGNTLQNSLLGFGGKGLPKGLTEFNRLSGWKYLFKSAGQEGLEEFLQDLGTNLVDAFFDLWDKGYAAEGLNMQTLVDAFFAGFLSSLVLSGYHIGRNAARSARVNRKAKKTGDYDHDNGFGPGDIVFETVVDGESKFQKVGPLGKLYYSSILRDFDEALKTLEKSRMQGSAPDIELAQEVYTGLSQMAQYFQGFDKKRLLNCQRLLNALSGEEISVTSYMHGMQERLQVDDAAVRQQKFVSDVYEILRDMPKSALPNMDKLRSIARRVAPAEVIAVADKSGTKKRRGRPRKADKTSEKAPTGEALTEKLLAAQRRADELLGEKEEKTLEELARDFNLVIVTDGKEVDFDDDYKTLAVPAAWLKNYSRMPIWQTITQTQLVRKLCVQSPKTQGILLFFDRRVRPVVEKYFKNSGKKDTKNLRRETVVMQFLFNPIVYQEVLLGENGAIHEHTNVLWAATEWTFPTSCRRRLFRTFKENWGNKGSGRTTVL